MKFNRSKNVKLDQDAVYNWWDFCFGYLDASNLILTEIEKKCVTKNDKKNNRLLISFFYNFRHFMELSIKFCNLFYTGKIDSSEDFTHDLSLMLEKFKSIMQEMNNDKDSFSFAIGKFKEEVLNPNNFKEDQRWMVDLLFNDKDGGLEEDSTDFIDELEKMILRFYRMDLIKEKSGKNIKIDKKNETFRYPNSELLYKDILLKIDEQDLSRLKTESALISLYLMVMVYITGQYIIKKSMIKKE
jgi:hypothetical protein